MRADLREVGPHARLDFPSQAPLLDMNHLALRIATLASLAAPLLAQTTDEVFKLRPKSAANVGAFGTTVATTTNLAVVGASLAQPLGTGSGAAFVFELQGGKQVKRLLPTDGGPNQHFGTSVAIEGNQIAVGAMHATGAAAGSGAVYLFDATTGAQTAKFNAPGGQQGDLFGGAVALNSNRVLAGARGWSAELAYLFDATSGSVIHVFAPDPGLGGWFGNSVALRGQRAVVGAPDAGSGVSRGVAYLYDATSGQLIARLDPPTGDDDDFGRSVALNSGVVLVGAPGSGRAGSTSGAAYLYDADSGAYLGALDAPETNNEDGFGRAVAISGNTAVVGAWWAGDREWMVGGQGAPVNGGSGHHTGMAYVFDLTSGQLQSRLLPKHVMDFDLFGCSAAIDGDTIVVGSYWGRAAYVFR
jgi:FG-GAP repeat